MNDRTCIVTRQCLPAEEMIRFVAGPDDTIVADLKAKLPGRGCWVTARRDLVEKAAKKDMFSRALKRKVAVPPDLTENMDRQMVDALTGMMNLARKAGQIVLGATKTESAVRSGQAIAVFHAIDAAEDGVRKIAQARHARYSSGENAIPSFRLLSAQEMSVISGEGNLIHLAVLAGQAGEGVVKRAKILDRYRGEAPTGRTAGRPAKETESE